MVLIGSVCCYVQSEHDGELMSADSARQGKSSKSLEPRIKDIAKRYGLALVLIGLSVGLQAALHSSFGNQFTGIILILGTLVASWQGGFGPGISVGLLGLFSIAILFPVEETENKGQFAGVVLFLVLIVCIALFGSGMARSRRKAELAASKLKTTLASIGDAFIVTDNDGNIESMNASAEAILGYRPANISEVLSSESASTEGQTETATDNNFIGPLADSANDRLMRKDGAVRLIEKSISDIHADGGPALGKIIVFRDVTQRRREDQMLRMSEQRFRGMADAAPILIWMSDTAKKLNWFNKPWLDFTGATLFEEAAGAWLQRIHPEDQVDYLKKFANAFDKRTSFEREFRLRRNDGEYRWMSDRGVPYFDRDTFIGYIGSAIDVTDRKSALERAENLAVQLSVADHRKDAFMESLAHELRDPLAAIVTGIEILKVTTARPNDGDGIAETLERQSRQIVSLVDDLLDISHIKNNELKLKNTVFPIREVLSQAMEANSLMIQEAHQTCTLECPKDGLHVKGDMQRLTQVFSNLLNNASKFSPHGSTITIRAAAGDDAATITVKDQGIGIPAERISSVFETFDQIDRPKDEKTTGIGLGLTLVKSLVEMHGGKISLQSEGKNKGTEFTVSLPIIKQAPAPHLAKKPKTTPEAQKLRILVSDDNEDGANLLALTLRMQGHDVRIAFNGEEAVRKAETFLPQVILMDIGMPVMDGLQAAKMIREQDWSKGMVMFALTGWGNEEDKRRSVQAGFDHHFVKPVDPVELRTYIAKQPAFSKKNSDSKREKV